MTCPAMESRNRSTGRDSLLFHGKAEAATRSADPSRRRTPIKRSNARPCDFAPRPIGSARGTPPPSGASCYAMAHTLAALEESIGRSLKWAWGSTLRGATHFLDARKVLRGSISKESRRGLDWLNFFL